jgi:putative addiction module antidote
MTALTIRKIGNSEGVILPKEILAKMHVSEGDRVFVTEAPGGFYVRNYDPVFEQQMSVAEGIMREDRDVLKKLAE